MYMMLEENFFKQDLYINFVDKLVDSLKAQCKQFTFDTAEGFDENNKKIVFNYDRFSGKLFPEVYSNRKYVYFGIIIEVSEIDRSKLNYNQIQDIDIIEEVSRQLYELVKRDYSHKDSVWYSYPDKENKLELTKKGLLKIYKDGKSTFLQYTKETESIQLKPDNSAASPLYTIRRDRVELNIGYDLNKLRQRSYISFVIDVNKKEDLISDNFIEDVVIKFKSLVDPFFSDNKKYLDNLNKEHNKNISIIKDYLLTALAILEQNTETI